MTIKITGSTLGNITGGPSSISLEDLADVSILAPETGEYLRYNASIEEWQNVAITDDVFTILDTSISGSDGISIVAVPGPNTITFSLGNITPDDVTASGVLSASNFSGTSSGTNTGDQTITLTGDVTGTGTGSFATTLSTVNASPQSDTFRKVTVNGKGLVTDTSTVVSADITTALGYTPVNVAGGTMSGYLILNADPVNPLGAVTKQYVDSTAEGLKAKPAVEAATTANLVSTYDNGVDGVGATLTATTNGAFPAVDGVTIATTDLGQNGVLVKNQTVPAQNGRYNLTQVGDGSLPWILTRCGVCDTANEIPGSYVFVKGGTQVGTGWVAVVADPSTFIVGTDDIDWEQFSGAGTYTGGTGIDVIANVISNTGVVSVIGGTNVDVSSATGSVTINVSGTVASATNLAGGAEGNIHYQSAAGVTAFLATGTSDQVLVSGTTPSWTNTPVLTGTNFTGIPNGALTNSSVTIGSTNIALGGTSTTLAGLTSVTSTVFNTTSTIRVKRAVKDIGSEYLTRFSLLKPREYDRTDYAAHEFGFIAEEMITVYPEVVGTDAAGNATGVDYGKLSTILTAKVQEQQMVIDQLKDQMSKVMELLKGLN